MEHHAVLPHDLDACLRVLEAIAADRALLASVDPERRRRLLVAAGRVSRPERADQVRLAKALRRADRRRDKAHDERIIAETELRRAITAPRFVAPASRPDAVGFAVEELRRPRSCYVCKAPFSRVHFFYDQMCPPCAELNYAKRHQTASLEGRVALVTGARIKIGYQAALMMLRAGARVLVTTRFPNDAALRYSREPDHEAWRDRLHVYGIDLRWTPAVERFARHVLETCDRLDFLVNNAAQTVRRPAAFYAHLIAGEQRPIAELPEPARAALARWEAFKPSLPEAALPETALVTREELELFPPGQLDADLQQVDLRPVNSWRLLAAEVPTAELLEVHLVNAIAPFVLTSRLRPLMARARTGDRHVVNVSAMEASFSRRKKTDKHPHTNMAKAALNMLTRTSAQDFVRDGIHMNSVDTGWVTDEDPRVHITRKQRVHGFWPPLDVVDGAARVLDPIFAGLLTGEHAWGKFFKDYRPVNW